MCLIQGFVFFLSIVCMYTRVCVVCVREREGSRECVCLFDRGGGAFFLIFCVYVYEKVLCVCEREGGRVCVCVCLRV